MSCSERLYTWYAERHEETHAQFAASGGFRLHWRQSAVDYAMTGAEELERIYLDTYTRARDLQRREPLKSQDIIPLSAHWWHG